MSEPISGAWAGLHTDLDDMNAIKHGGHKNSPLTEAFTDFRRAHEQVLAALEKLSDVDLFKIYSRYQPDEPGEDSGERPRSS